MTGLPERVERAFAGHEAFEPAEGDTFAATTTPFEAVVGVRAGDAVAVEVTVWVPTLSAAVAAGEEVAGPVEEGWLDTFRRRMGQAHMPMRARRDLDPEVAVEGEEVVVTAAFEDPDPNRAADDARALVEYVEGTYLEGAIPGYEYDEPVAGLRRRAREAGGVDDEGGPPL